MLVVKIEMHSARTGKITELGNMIIANDGTGEPNRGNYNVIVGRRGQHWRTAPKRPVRTGRVENFPRNAYSVWRLVLRALRSAYPEEK